MRKDLNQYSGSAWMGFHSFELTGFDKTWCVEGDWTYYLEVNQKTVLMNSKQNKTKDTIIKSFTYNVNENRTEMDLGINYTPIYNEIKSETFTIKSK